MIDTQTALLYTCAMGAVIFFCRSLPFFLNFSPKLLAFVEKTVPPAAMTVLAFNALAVPVKQSLTELDPLAAIPALTAAALCAVLHIVKRNALISIFTSTALYMVLIRIFS